MSLIVHFFPLLLCHYFLFTSLLPAYSHESGPSSYLLSPTIFPHDYQNMLASFRIYIYAPPKPFSFTSPAESRFFSSLRTSNFVTRDPEEAHLFFVPFPSDLSTRSIARVIRDIRAGLPFWNRTLGADHFYVSCSGLDYGSDRNLLELKKNSVQISCFPAQEGKFVPHKDVTLPPLGRVALPPANRTGKVLLGFARYNAVRESTLVKELRKDSDFLIESEPSDEGTLAERMASSEFCLFEYGGGGGGDVSGIGEALRLGCVPVVVTGRPIQDLPLMDVLRWQEIALFVGPGGGAKGIKRVLGDDHAREKMRSLGMAAGQHLLWNEREEQEQYGAFHMLMYQLWLRRHTIRYARRQS